MQIKASGSPIGSWLATALRASARGLLAVHVLSVGLGVSVPATAADDFSDRRVDHRRPSGDESRQNDVRRERRPEPVGERGHVRRRDTIDRSSHVEKREGWRRID